MDDVLLLPWLQENLHVHLLNTSLVLENLSVLVYDIVEGHLETWLHLAHTIDCAHDKLVNVSVDKNMSFCWE